MLVSCLHQSDQSTPSSAPNSSVGALRFDARGCPTKRLGTSSKPTAFRYVRSYIEKINEECSEDASMIRSMELERLDVILKHNMKVVENKNGQYRPSEVAKASEVVMKTQERRTKYLGLDSSGDNGVVEVKFVREG